MSFRYCDYSCLWNFRLLWKSFKSSNVVQASMYDKFRKSMIFLYWPNKSHDVTIGTPTNHSSSCWDIIFHSVENNVGIVRRFVISKKGSSFQINSKLRRNHDLNAFAQMDISFTDSVHHPPTLIPFESWDSQLSACVITFWCHTGEFVN